MITASRPVIIWMTFFLIAMVTSCRRSTPPQLPAVEVSTLIMHSQSVPLQRELNGRLSAFRSADVRARVEGVLQARSYEEGSDVRQDQPLFRIDPVPLQAALKQAQGQLMAAQANATNAFASARRLQRLGQQQFVSQSDIDAALAQERSTAAAVTQMQAAVASAKIRLDYANVCAPIAGRAGMQQVTEGAFVSPSGQSLLTTIEQIDQLYLNFSMPAEDLTNLRIAQDQRQIALTEVKQRRVRVRLNDHTWYPHDGNLDFSSVTVDPSTGTVSLRALIPNPDHLLLPGTFVQFQLELGQRDNVFLVPEAALQRDANSAFVFLVDGQNKVRQQPVDALAQFDNQWIVTAGLQNNDRIVVDGTITIREGQIVKPQPWHDPSTQQQALLQQPTHHAISPI